MIKYFKFSSVGLLIIIAHIGFFLSCKESVPPKISDQGLSVPDFLKIAPELSLPVTIHENDLSQIKYDSSTVHLPTFKSYFKDSLFQTIFGEKRKQKISVVGKVQLEDKSTYLVVREVSGKNKSAIIIYFNPKGNYLGHLVLISPKQRITSEKYSFKIDSKLNISLITERQISKEELWTGEKIYYFDPSGLPIIAVTNTNEDLSNEILGNPIDSIPRKNKYAGDYSTDKKNLVSIRDGRTEKSMQFFIHFSKRQGNCVGEIKGEADWVNKNFAVFRDNKSQCIIEFRFSYQRVTIRETNGCGSYRDIKCTFEGSYPKVKKMHYSK